MTRMQRTVGFALLLASLAVTTVATAQQGQQAPAAPLTGAPDPSKPPAPEHDNGETLWPQQATQGDTTYVIYTPQVQSMVGVQATARAAFSWAKGKDAAKYGAMFFTADTDADLAAGLIEFANMKVTSVKLPDGTQDAALQGELSTMLSGVQFTVPRAVVMENMQVARTQAANSSKLGNTPPRIKVLEQPAVLLQLDGHPVMRELPDTTWGAAQNTGSLLLKDRSSGTWYTLLGTDTWMQSRHYTGPWDKASAPPANVMNALQRALPQRHPDAVANAAPAGTALPTIVVATRPTCLVSIAGQPALQQVAPDLQAVSNSNCDLFTTKAGGWYLLASGRWFTTNDLLDGTWTYVRPSALPASFASIDPSGPWGNVLSSVPGTTQATQAVWMQQVPHVATLDRSKAVPKVSTIGGPAKFAPITGTDMKYAKNASAPLIECQGKYYLCDNAAWFVGSSATGPWALCDKVPQAIYSIPPSCPVYNATYVQVYNSDDQTVTQGYTAGYMNSFENDGTVAYGTGYSTPGYTSQGDLWIGDNSDIEMEDTWDSYGGWPGTYYGNPYWAGDYGCWGFGGYPGWGYYGLGCGPMWGAPGWWGPGWGFGVGYGLGCGWAGAWGWGYHPWGWRNYDGWWSHHWDGAYRRNWSNAARDYNRAGAAGDMGRYGQIGHYGQIGPYRSTPGAANRAAGLGSGDGGVGRWSHAAGVSDDTYASRNGSVMQRRGDDLYTRSNGGWHQAGAGAGASDAASVAQPGARANDGTWRDGAGAGANSFQERDGSVQAASRARQADDTQSRPDPNHNYDGSPRGAFARGETNYGDAHGYAGGTYGEGGNGNESAYNRAATGWGGGGFRGGNGGWGESDQRGSYAQRYGNDYDRGTAGFNQDSGWYDRSASRPASPYGYGYTGWSNGYRGMGQLSGWSGNRGGSTGYRGGSSGGARGGGGGGRR